MYIWCLKHACSMIVPYLDSYYSTDSHNMWHQATLCKCIFQSISAPPFIMSCTPSKLILVVCTCTLYIIIVIAAVWTALCMHDNITLGECARGTLVVLCVSVCVCVSVTALPGTYLFCKSQVRSYKVPYGV
jgi:hypothetical protein